MTRLASARRRSLAAGAVLAACGLASGALAGGQGMYFAQVGNLTGQIVTDVGTFNIQDTPMTSYMYFSDSKSGPGGPVTFSQTAYGDLWLGNQEDYVFFSLTSPLTLASSGTGTFDMTFSVDVVWNEIGSQFATWTIDGFALADGARLNAGTYTFGWTLNADDFFVTFGGWFAQAQGGSVPLPGAAGLAAVAFAGVARRRRR